MLSKLDLNYLDLFKKKYVYSCPVCGGKDSFCHCWKKYNEEIKKVAAGIPVKYRKYTIDDFTHPQLKKQKETVQKAIKDFDNFRLNGGVLYFYGTSGTAKTMSAILIAVEGIKRGYEVHYYDSLQSIATQLKQSWAEDNTSEIMKHITASDLIVVDNLGSENINSANVANEILGMFKQRSYNCLPVIFVAPVEPAQLPLTLDGNIVELFASNSFQQVFFKGFDYSKKVLGEN